MNFQVIPICYIAENLETYLVNLFVEMHCDVIVAPVSSADRVFLVAASRYDRWCQEVPTPTEVEITASYSAGKPSPTLVLSSYRSRIWLDSVRSG